MSSFKWKTFSKDLVCIKENVALGKYPNFCAESNIYFVPSLFWPFPDLLFIKALEAFDNAMYAAASVIDFSFLLSLFRDFSPWTTNFTSGTTFYELYCRQLDSS